MIELEVPTIALLLDVITTIAMAKILAEDELPHSHVLKSLVILSFHLVLSCLLVEIFYKLFLK